ncbi:hypothetical protein JB92DRAFT_3205176 [Gautieria morchelliformis]|nr:hypothetical protein JB92DRAFT_3205176 [Gautieria morchelliformis]
MRRLLQPKNRMVSRAPGKTTCYITSPLYTLHTLSFPTAVLLYPLVCLSFQPSLSSTLKSTNPFTSAPPRSQRNSCRQCITGKGSHKQLNTIKAARRIDRLGSTACSHL